MSKATHPINNAEWRVLNAFKTGQEKVVVSPECSAIPYRPADDQSKANWKGAILRAKFLRNLSILRASFLRDLFLGNYGNFNPQQVMISQAIIKGTLDLNFCESKLPLAFYKCIFSEGISLWGATIPLLSLKSCGVHQPKGGDKALFAPYMKVITNLTLNDGFKANGEVDLNGAEIGGQFKCSGGHFGGGLTAQGLKTGESIFLTDKFKSNGKVDLNGMEIGGQLDCSGGHFGGGLTAQGLKTGDSVFLTDNFKANGEVYLIGAEIGGQLSCSGGHFRRGLIAQNLKTRRSVLLRNEFKANGRVDLNGAEIGGQLICSGGYFGRGLIAQNLKTKDDVFLGGEFKAVVDSNDAKDGVNLNGADIGQSLYLNNASIRGRISLYNVEVHAVFQNLQKWPDHTSCSADGFRYWKIEDGGNWKTGLAWLNKVSESTEAFCPQPYEQLMAVYRRMGHTNWAREIGFALERRRHDEFSWKKGGSWRNWLSWNPWYYILRWTIGYCYKPFRFFWWAASMLMIGWILFSSGHDGLISKLAPSSWQAPTFLANKWIPSDVEALESTNWRDNRKPPQDYPSFNPFVHSLEATLPVLPLGQLDKWHPSNRILLGVRRAWIFAGSVLLAILTLFGAGKLGPSWKYEGDSG